MKRSKALVLISAIFIAALSAACGGSEQRTISATVREHVQRNLDGNSTFGYVGLSNRRDTVFMGAARPCAGVIYTVTDNETSESVRHYADVIFSDDYTAVLSMKELDFDPVEMAGDAIREQLTDKLLEKLGR